MAWTEEKYAAYLSEHKPLISMNPVTGGIMIATAPARWTRVILNVLLVVVSLGIAALLR